ncbi:efflux transporter periplasmic adaptor subunit [Acidithiobacillus marinus]|uniref:Efflux transporter periplasmic adaptor subunit n=1 Tax=Acidithiobacillus marinus TaxID=187490 RepID=A0A2I1DMG9_9PROT|nr:efflux RND transporter periplasmic adaptor subunit [Acidithiobacillus marinus]PKY11062.1 efflux transporter periplasmic adaptor subunit [Acidithiobacillus marinus]
MSRYPLIFLLSTAVLGIAGCQGKARHEIPPLQVELVSPRVQDMTHYIGYLGTVTPIQTVTVIPQTSGLLQHIAFTQGTMVHKGQHLFTIDPSQTQAALAQAQAKLAADQATARYNQNLVDQERPLVEKDFITRQSFDQAVSQAQAARAQIAEDQAAVTQARINLSYTHIVAPISGRIGLALVKAGNLVVANQTQLTTINEISPITINFSVPQAELAAARQAQQQKSMLSIMDEKGGSTLAQGKLTFIDNTVSANTATINLQATVPNTDFKLWPGQYVQVQMPVQHVDNALVLPVGAVQQGSSGPFVYAVEQGKASDKPVQVLWETGTQAVISGISSTDRVVFPLPARIYPGAAVQVGGKNSSFRHTHSGKAS